MESTVVVVGDPSEARIGDCLSKLRSAGIGYTLCPNVFDAAACLAGMDIGGLVGFPQTLGAEQGQLLALAVQSGWQCALLVESAARIPNYAWLARLSERVYLLPAHDDEAWQHWIVSVVTETRLREQVKPQDLASPEEVDALLGGWQHD